jgi:HD-like signal output (HDOD) protein/ActR/RegA family two-component response regulator
MGAEESSTLIVNDKTAICSLLANELAKRGVSHSIAPDGIEASRLMETKSYQVVVTDLRASNRQGEPFITELLQCKPRPLIIVQTGTLEPRLADELRARGVDEIFFNPVDCGQMAAKIKLLLDRRGRKSSADDDHTVQRKATTSTMAGDEGSLEVPVSSSQLTAKMSELSRVMPVSNAALDVYNMTRTDQWDMSELAAAAQRDAALTTEILRRANSAHYNTSGRHVSDLQEAVMRIGQRRVGELALTTSAMSMLTPSMLPWIDRDLDWKRSMAAGLAMELLIDQGRHVAIDDGLILSAVMQSMGQIVLGMLFPKHYDVMLKQCEQTGESLQELEKFFFPVTNTEIMAQVLAGWHIPAEVYLPLKFSLHEWSDLAELPEPTRSKAELVKLAVILGRISIDRCKSWDRVELPPTRVLHRLKINDVRQIIQSTRSDVNALAQFGRPDRLAKPSPKPTGSRIQLDYVATQDETIDTLAELLPWFGVEPRRRTMSEICKSNDPVIINCLGEKDDGALREDTVSRAIIFAAKDQSDVVGQLDEVITLPHSFGGLRNAFQQRLSEVVTRKEAGIVTAAN